MKQSKENQRINIKKHERNKTNTMFGSLLSIVLYCIVIIPTMFISIVTQNVLYCIVKFHYYV